MCHNSHHRLLALIMLLAIGLHGLVPAGYMPDFSGHGWLVFCDGSDHMAMPSGPGAGQMDHSHCNHHAAPCPYSVGAFFALDGITPPVLVPPTYESVLELTLPADERLAARHFANASPRSPPAFS